MSSSCTCIMISPATHLEPAEWEQNPDCEVHPMNPYEISDHSWMDHAWHIHKNKIKNWEVGSKEDLRFTALALVGEAGKMANLVKKEWRGDGPLDSKFADEIADIQIYLWLLAEIAGVDIAEACYTKIGELYARWPEIAPL